MWQHRPGLEHNFIDGRTHVHHVHLYNSVTGGEVEVQLLLHGGVCRECRRPFEMSDLGHIDPKAETAKVLNVLSRNHDAVMAYIQRHGVPVRIGSLAHLVPDGHRLSTHGDHRLLHFVKGDK